MTWPFGRARTAAPTDHAREARLASAAPGSLTFFVERMKLAVEPTGCFGTAAAFTGAVPVAGKRVGVIVSGGNVDPAALAGWLG